MDRLGLHAEKNYPIFNEVIAVCERQKIKKIMSYKHDWNDEIIAQFYATLYVEDHDADVRNWNMHLDDKGYLAQRHLSRFQ